MTSTSLDGRLVALTGATGILGRVYAKAFIDAGATVAIADISPQSCEQLTAELGSSAFSAPVDLTDDASVQSWSESLAKTGPVDVLVNNAAAKAPGFFNPLEQYETATWEAVMDVNVTGILRTTRAIGPAMARRGTGSIVNVASIYGVVGPDQRIYEGSWYEDLGGAINTPLVYSASKGAVIAMTRHLATLWGPSGVRTNCLTPGGVSSGQNAEFDRRYSDRVPLGRMAEASEMVGAMLYLASDASLYMNGQNLIVDGGLTAW